MTSMAAALFSVWEAGIYLALWEIDYLENKHKPDSVELSVADSALLQGLGLLEA